jgi:hypothetical protein
MKNAMYVIGFCLTCVTPASAQNQYYLPLSNGGFYQMGSAQAPAPLPMQPLAYPTVARGPIRTSNPFTPIQPIHGFASGRYNMGWNGSR